MIYLRRSPMIRILPALAALLFTASAYGQSPPVSDPSFFVKNLYPVLEKAQCRMCHNDNGVASATRLQFPPEDASAEEITRFGLQLKKLVNPADVDQSLLFRKPTNRISHTGGERIHPGTSEEKTLHAWIEYLASAKVNPELTRAQKRVAPAVLRRLTQSQYNHTLQDLIGDQTHPADQFPSEDFVHGFTNQAEEQSVSPLLAEAYNRAAEKAARTAFLGGDTRGLISCKPSGPADAECRGHFIREMGQRAFRRPLSDSEIRIYDKLFQSEAARNHSFVAGAQVVIEAMLQSPHFLFHLEGGLDGRSEGYRVASRLSYFLWDTMPDQALFDAAKSGELLTEAGIEKQAKRLLADERARASFDEFLSQWLRFDRLHSAVRDRRLFPEFSDELVNNMAEEVRQLFEHLVWENGNFLDFFKADYAYVSTDLARLYGLNPPAREFAKVKLPPDSERGGIPGTGLFLALTSKPSETSPTERGLFVREHFLCQVVPPPPPGVNTNLPVNTDGQPLTNRQRLKMHLSSPTCAACHNLIDPVGFGLERFDAIGRYKQKQVVTIFPTLDELKGDKNLKPRVHELDLDITASVRGIPNSDFSSPKQLGEILAAAPNCQRCIVKQLFRYAMGRLETPADQPFLDAALKEFQNSQFRFQNLIIFIVKSRAFTGGLEE
jgi:hypothetical protein